MNYFDDFTFELIIGIGGGAEAVIMAEITRSTEESKRTGIISKLIAVRQMGLLIGNILFLIRLQG